MKFRSRKKLELSRQSMRSLTAEETTVVAGGYRYTNGNRDNLDCRSNSSVNSDPSDACSLLVC